MAVTSGPEEDDDEEEEDEEEVEVKGVEEGEVVPEAARRRSSGKRRSSALRREEEARLWQEHVEEEERARQRESEEREAAMERARVEGLKEEAEEMQMRAEEEHMHLYLVRRRTSGVVSSGMRWSEYEWYYHRWRAYTMGEIMMAETIAQRSRVLLVMCCMQAALRAIAEAEARERAREGWERGLMYWEEQAMRELMHEEREREHMCVLGKTCWSSRENRIDEERQVLTLWFVICAPV
jgi:hypothetical protein